MTPDFSDLRPLDNYLIDISTEYIVYEIPTTGEVVLNWTILMKLFERIDSSRELEYYWDGCYRKLKPTPFYKLTCWFKIEQ